MNSFEIYANGHIALDGAPIDYGVCNTPDGTRLRRISDDTIIGLPHPVYSLSHDSPASGIPGRGAFERDLRIIVGK